jgi:hypothetical protein
MEQEWQNVVFGDHVGTLAVQNGSLNFVPRAGEQALFSVPLLDFSCKLDDSLQLTEKSAAFWLRTKQWDKFAWL